MADISGKPMQMSFISLSLQSCAAGTAGSLWRCSGIPCSYPCRHKGCLHLSRPHILQKYDLYFLVCSVVKPTAEKWLVQFLWTLIVTSYPGKFEQSPIKLPYADNHLASAHLAYQLIFKSCVLQLAAYIENSILCLLLRYCLKGPVVHLCLQ